MTKKEVVALVMALAGAPFACLQVPENEFGPHEVVILNVHQYTDQMYLGHRPWSVPGGRYCWYDEETSDAMQDKWYWQCDEVQDAMNEYDRTHKVPLSQKLRSSVR